MEEIFPKLQFQKTSGNTFNFPTSHFDLVYSNATIEHVGGRDNQRIFISEMLRVAKHFIFFTTPNKWFPIELHTAIPFLHYLPSKFYRTILWHLGFQFFSKEENLNLLDKNDIVSLLKSLNISNYAIKYSLCFGLPSNICVFIKKID